MGKSFLLIVMSSAFFLSSLYTHATIVNPQPGDSVWTIACRVGQVLDRVTPTPVFNTDESGGIITLSSAGHYWVAENLIYPIVISADEVHLDLNCKKVSSSDGGTNLITINSGLKYINIHNGRLINTDAPIGTGAGILIQNSSSCIRVEKIQTVGCGNGVKLDGQDGNEIIECELIALDLVSNTTGLVLSHADENVIKECCAFRNTQAGFELLNSEANCFYDCQALKTFGEQSTMGFTSRAGQSNLFQRCVAKKTKTSAWEFCNKAYGFLLTSTEEKTKIIDCIVNETDVTSTVSAVAYGICLEPILLEGSYLLHSVTNNNTPDDSVYAVAWSPDGKYIASGDWGNYVRVFSFDGSSLMRTCSDNKSTNNVESVAWSPDGKYIVTGDNGNYIRIYSFNGSNITYIDGNNTPGGYVRSVAWSPDGKYIASGDFGDYVRVFGFDGANINYISDDNTPTGNVYSVAWSPDGNYIVSGDAGYYVRVFSFDGSNLTHIDDLEIPDSIICSVAWSPDGKYIVSGDDNNYVRVFSFDGSILAYIDGDDTPSEVLRSVAWSPDGKYIVSGDNGNYVRVFSFDGANINYIDGTNTPGFSVFSVAWSPDGNYIASGDLGDYVRVFDAMYGPEHCIVQGCTIADTAAYGQFVGTGIAGAGTSCFVSNVCCNNEVNYTYGIPNVFYGGHNIERNTQRPFDNISMPMTQ